MKKKRGFIHELKKNRILYLMVLPAMLVTFVISYIPMSGIILAFKNYRFNLGIFGSPWADNHGFGNFRFFFLSGTGFTVTKNTLLFNLLNLVTSQGLAIILALFLNEMRGKIFKKVTQSMIFLPYFISWIIVGAFVYNIFDYKKGVLNTLIQMFDGNPIDMYSIPWVWIIIICLFNTWKWAGYNSIIYMAAISNVDTECYEAADIDGASIWQKVRYITLPGIRPTIVTIFLLNIGRILRGDFQMFYQIIGNNGQLFQTTDVIDTFVFRALINSGDIGMTAAASVYQSFLCFIIIMVVNAVIKRVEPEYALF